MNIAFSILAQEGEGHLVAFAKNFCSELVACGRDLGTARQPDRYGPRLILQSVEERRGQPEPGKVPHPLTGGLADSAVDRSDPGLAHGPRAPAGLTGSV